MVRPLLLSALLVLSGCSTQSPSASDDTFRDAPDPVETAAYSEGRAGEASVVWEEEEIVLEQGQNGYDLDDPQKIPLHPIVEKQIRALAQMRREQRRLLRQLRRIQRQTDRAIEAELTAKQVEAYRAFRDEQRERRHEAWQERR